MQKVLNQENNSELQLIHLDLFSDALFLIGTIISIFNNTEAEQEIVNPGENQSSRLNSELFDVLDFGLGPIPLLLFLLGTILIAFTTGERLEKQKAEAGGSADQTTVNNIRGGELVIIGQLTRIIGYIISIIGEQIRNANPV